MTVIEMQISQAYTANLSHAAWPQSNTISAGHMLQIHQNTSDSPRSILPTKLTIYSRQVWLMQLWAFVMLIDGLVNHASSSQREEVWEVSVQVISLLPSLGFRPIRYVWYLSYLSLSVACVCDCTMCNQIRSEFSPGLCITKNDNSPDLHISSSFCFAIHKISTFIILEFNWLINKRFSLAVLQVCSSSTLAG